MEFLENKIGLPDSKFIRDEKTRINKIIFKKKGWGDYGWLKNFAWKSQIQK